MSVTIIRGSDVTKPTTTPRGSGIIDHATVQERQGSDFYLRNNEGLWPSLSGDGSKSQAWDVETCAGPSTGLELDDYAGVRWDAGFVHLVQSGASCSNVGTSLQDTENLLRENFDLQESSRIESAVLASRFIARAAAGTVDRSSWDAPTNLNTTYGSTLNVDQALAILEEYSTGPAAGDKRIAGGLTIHMAPSVASLLGDALVWEGGKAYTRLGSKVVVGSGYSAGLNTGGSRMYATGDTYIERSSEITVSALTLPADAATLGSNTHYVSLQRAYRVVFSGTHTHSIEGVVFTP